MKKKFLLLTLMFCLSLGIISCSSKPAKETSTENTKSTDDTAVESEDDSVTAEEGSEDWDSFLDDYEEYIDSYIKMAKKAQAGDVSAVAEYADCLEKAQSMDKKLENAEAELSESQLKRFMAIQTKLLSAIQKMSK